MKNKLTFSLLFTFTICVLNAINFALDGILFNKFAMFTANFFTQMEVWRILSFSVFFNSFEGILLFITSFYFISPRLEFFFSKKIYPLFLSLITILVGTITALIFVNTKTSFGGFEGVSWFIITLFFFLVYNKILIRDTSLSKIAVVSTSLIWVGTKFYLLQTQGLHSILPSVTMALIGTIIGSLVFLQIHYLVKSRIKKAKMRVRQATPNPLQHNIPSKEEVGYTIYSNPKFKEIFGRTSFPDYSLVAEQLEEIDTYTTEKPIDENEQLDMILDKISATGQESLTATEKKFLSYYSQKLKEK